MSKYDDGGPAFPKVPDDFRNGSAGMSLRDYFAGQVINQVLALAVEKRRALINPEPFDACGAAASAYEMADAMLAEREKESR